MAKSEIPRGRVRRTAPLAGMATRTAGTAVVGALRQKLTGADPAELHERAAVRYAERLGRSKGVLMKAGQLLSFVSLEAVVPAEYLGIYQSALARLQDSAPPMAYEEAAAVVEEELGRPVAEAYAEFDPVPIAAASIGQVHAATLHDGRRVAVKVQYPGVAEAIRADLANTELLATFFQVARGIVPGARIDARAVGREIAERIGEEIDYEIEARNQRDFADAYRGHPFIRVPDVVPELSTQRVLTQDLAEGLRWAEALDAPQELRDRWGEIIYRFAIGSMRRLHLFNADPHPGNYLFGLDGTVTFLDFGCVKRFEADHIATMRDWVWAAVDDDADRLVQAGIRHGWIAADNPPDGEKLLRFMRSTLRPLTKEQPFSYTPQVAACILGGSNPFAPDGRSVIGLTPPPDFAVLARIDAGMTSVLGALRASGHWRDIAAEWDLDGPPAGLLGEVDQEFWNVRAGR